MCQGGVGREGSFGERWNRDGTGRREPAGMGLRKQETRDLGSRPGGEG